MAKNFSLAEWLTEKYHCQVNPTTLKVQNYNSVKSFMISKVLQASQLSPEELAEMLARATLEQQSRQVCCNNILLMV